MVFKTNIKVRYAETDMMGIVHHSVYPVWYEVTRTEFLDNLGIPNVKLEEMGIKTPLSELETKYLLPAHYSELLCIETKIIKLTPARIKIEYKIFNEKEELINIGVTTHAWVGKDLKIINLKKNFPKIYSIFEKIVE